ncbi:hypothetical protein CMEL01_15711 [Colletotrichum melonis]|uniref:Uncharacterized protein n=1 Tax=Colletotrichum melonis TaxID=1209925 RepID=A0AAI9UG04_9PEZI|nr:hypothetical protein CMEL01_15711 [Colletotrichum melonis]
MNLTHSFIVQTSSCFQIGPRLGCLASRLLPNVLPTGCCLSEAKRRSRSRAEQGTECIHSCLMSDMVEQWSDCPRCSQRNLQGGSSMSKRVCTTSPRSSTTPSPTGPRGPSRIVAFFRLRSIINLRALPTVGLDFRLIQPKDVDGGEEP